MGTRDRGEKGDSRKEVGAGIAIGDSSPKPSAASVLLLFLIYLHFIYTNEFNALTWLYTFIHFSTRLVLWLKRVMSMFDQGIHYTCTLSRLGERKSWSCLRWMTIQSFYVLFPKAKPTDLLRGTKLAVRQSCLIYRPSSEAFLDDDDDDDGGDWAAAGAAREINPVVFELRERCLKRRRRLLQRMEWTHDKSISFLGHQGM